MRGGDDREAIAPIFGESGRKEIPRKGELRADFYAPISPTLSPPIHARPHVRAKASSLRRYSPTLISLYYSHFYATDKSDAQRRILAANPP